MHGMRRAALAIAAVGAGAAGAPRLLCRALRPSWDDMVGSSRMWGCSPSWLCRARQARCLPLFFFLLQDQLRCDYRAA